MEGVDHSCVVSACTLYEAVARGLVSLRKQEWVAGVALEVGVVRVSVAELPVEHSVKLQDFNKWIRRDGGSPRDVFARGRIREILGLPV